MIVQAIAVGNVPPSVLVALMCLAGSTVFALVLLGIARRQERRNFIYGRAPVLPIRVLAEHDDAWIKGRIQSDQPLQCPWFDVPCVYYTYGVERRETVTEVDERGRMRTSTHWVTERAETRKADFDLVEEGSQIRVRGEKAEFWHGQRLGGSDGMRRYSALIMPLNAEVWVLGVKQWEEPKGQVFSFLREVPLLVSPQGRKAFLTKGSRRTNWMRGVALFLSLLGGLGAGWFLVFDPNRAEGALPATTSRVLAVIAIALSVLLPVWLVVLYNRFVRTQQKWHAAFRQIDVDIDVRDKVIPNLVAVVEGYKTHEKSLFESIAKLRRQNDAGAVPELIAHDELAQSVSRGLLGLSEAYPSLRSEPNFMLLHQQLWALEEKLQASRTFYNDVVKEWNDLVQQFPSSLVAGLFGHKEKDYFRHLARES